MQNLIRGTQYFCFRTKSVIACFWLANYLVLGSASLFALPPTSDSWSYAAVQKKTYVDEGDIDPGGGGTPPYVTITSPNQNLATNVNSLNVSGTYSNANSVSVNGVPASLIPQGNQLEAYQNSNQDGGENLAATSSQAKLSQSFSANASGNLTQVSLSLCRQSGSPAGQLSVEIQEDDGTGKPNNIPIQNGSSSLISEASLNPAFIDESDYAHPINPLGSSTIDSQQKKLGSGSAYIHGANNSIRSDDHPDWQLKATVNSGASAFFDGAGDYLTLPDHNNWYLGGGSGAWTVDFWVKFNDLSTYRGFAHQYDGTNEWGIFWMPNSGGFLTLYSFDQVANTLWIQSQWMPRVGVWYHIAFTRSGNSFRIFINGKRLGQVITNSSQTVNVAAPLEIGKEASNAFLNGWMSEFRISNIARWTSDFVVPAPPYSGDGNTKLLLHLANDFNDSGSAAQPVTVNGNVALTTDSFVHETDFSIDFWTRFGILPTAQIPSVFAVQSHQSDFNTRWNLVANGSEVEFWASQNGAPVFQAFYPWSPAINTWYHVAFVREVHRLRLFVNGSEIALSSLYDGYTYLMPDANGSLYIGGHNLVQNWFHRGWVDEFRISGKARWTTNFTPPSTEYSPDADTKFLVHFNDPFQMRIFTFPNAPTVQAGNKYYAVLKTSRPVDTFNYVAWGRDASSPGFSDGMAFIGTANNPSVWTPVESKDHIFSVTIYATSSTFTAEGIPLAEGENSVTAVASNGSDSDQDTRQVILDTIPPPLNLTPTLEERKGMTESSYAFVAQAPDNDPATPNEYQFEINGAVLQPFSLSNNFSYMPSTGDSGEKTLTIRSRDVGGENSQDIGIYIYRRPL